MGFLQATRAPALAKPQPPDGLSLQRAGHPHWCHRSSSATSNDAAMVRQTSLTNGTGLAKYSDEFAKNSQGEILKACNIFRVTELPIVDFLFVIDDTYSMEPYQTQLTEATTEIFEAIQSSFVFQHVGLWLRPKWVKTMITMAVRVIVG